jgi:hypothetical protein
MAIDDHPKIAIDDGGIIEIEARVKAVPQLTGQWTAHEPEILH